MLNSFFQSRSLRVKILGLLFIVLALAIGVILLVLWHHQKNELIAISHQNAKDLGLTIEASLLNAMQDKDRNSVQTIINNICKTKHLRQISILNTKSTVVLSTAKEQVGTILEKNTDSSCTRCHGGERVMNSLNNGAFEYENPAGPTLRSIIKINNTQNCYSCHSQKDKINGMLVIDSSLEDIYSILHSITVKIIATGAVAFVILSGFISFIINRFVSKPVMAFIEGIRKTEQGDYHSWVEIEGAGEFSEMATSFNVMKKATRRYLHEMQNQNDEISTLYTIVQRMSETIEIKKVKSIIVNLILDIFQADNVLLVVSLENQKDTLEINSNQQNGNYVHSRYSLNSYENPHPLLSREELLKWLHGKKDTSPLFRADNTQALIPLYLKEINLGLLVIKKNHPETFRTSEKKIIPALTHHIVISLANARLYDIAITDELTRLYTKRHFLAKIQNLEKSFIKTNQRFCLLMMDLDFFKKVNDSYGHLTGDYVLRDVAHLIRLSLRQGDIPCRFGGEEFAIILPDTDTAAAEKIASRLLLRIADHDFKYKNLPDIKLTISIGIGCFPNHASNWEELITVADSALYKAKQLGRNQLSLPNN